ncbi:MAG: DNA recombination protein RmuC [Armatimonadota bacterium]|nr:DNA recombination protein RmuC [Armatimonadota bacterium]MDR7516664.1 DNA recombination protein RmuC [Armatimonadota bacterium]MDR7559936.1 DNA recombination protein RmuC [Armatimonadota bacterium]MDR7587505.1 DNA recombination protein RmuC [Armatimonadota bacterium]MDR7610912.1 DNA recombination protein RmuC [Armatimonadota bacterium]
MATSAVLVFVSGFIVGGLAVWLLTRTHLRREERRVAHLDQELASLRQAHADALVQLAELRKAAESDQEKLRWVERAEQVLRETFQALAADALKSNTDSLLGRVADQLHGLLAEVRGDWQAGREHLARLLEPLAKNLDGLEREVRELEQKREGAYQRLQEQLRQLAQTHADLQTAAQSLGHALKSTGTRGRWGEMQLRRIVEAAGMVEHVDFSEQVTTDAGRPDLLVHLPYGGVICVDAKAPMQAYLESLETDEPTRSARLEAHVKALRQHVQQLAAKRYWEQFSGSPELTVMFIPSEAALAAAFEREPTLLDTAIQQRVLLTSPVTLLALLKAVGYGWQQRSIAENARAIADLGRQLHERLRSFLESFVDLGKRLDSAVKYYNTAAGALNQRVLPAARHLGELGAGGEELAEAPLIERQAVTLPVGGTRPDGE